ncbi:hypothetical protein AVEN_204614-1 [Araneus ventricosus]|uniref:Uncharacterized protein n=1 Tax=Araneus ventricosus TaxID=182803 RepID=A0A4Y2TCR5_ARAVE|nr:hypothetical protein AVEN_204614-1 [Araneus ventricosus]
MVRSRPGPEGLRSENPIPPCGEGYAVYGACCTLGSLERSVQAQVSPSSSDRGSKLRVFYDEVKQLQLKPTATTCIDMRTQSPST